MRSRREFVVCFWSLALALRQGPALAQGASGLRRVGILADPAQVRIIEEGLRSHGWRVGENVSIVSKGATRLDQAQAIIEEFVRLPVDVLVIFTDAAASVAVKATRAIPIVMVTTGAVVEDGLVASLARPDRNLTGLSFDAPKEITGKRLALLKAMAPGISRVAFLIESIGTPGEHEGRASSPETLSAARALGLTVFPVLFTTREQLEDALAATRRQGADAVLISEGVILNTPAVQERIHAFSAQHRLPALHSILSGAETGGLMAYGVDVRAFTRRASYFVDRILKGTRPANLPIEQPDKLHLVVNARAARSLGLVISPSLRVEADPVIE